MANQTTQDEKKRGWFSRHKIFTALIIFIGIFVVIGIVGSSLPPVPQTPTTTKVTPTVIPSVTLSLAPQNARDIFSLYQSNEMKADDNFKGRWALITGKVDKVGKDMFGNPYVEFSPSSGQLFCVQCVFDEPMLAKDQTDKLESLVPGQDISIVGKCYGKVADVIFKSCEIIATKKLTTPVKYVVIQ